jgi:hypothetical protein
VVSNWPFTWRTVSMSVHILSITRQMFVRLKMFQRKHIFLLVFQFRMTWQEEANMSDQAHCVYTSYLVLCFVLDTDWCIYNNFCLLGTGRGSTHQHTRYGTYFYKNMPLITHRNLDIFICIINAVRFFQAFIPYVLVL